MSDQMRRNFGVALVAILHSSVQKGLAYPLGFAHGTAALMYFVGIFESILYTYRSRQVCIETAVEVRGARLPSIFPNSGVSMPCVYFLVATHYRVGCGLILVRDRTIDLILVWLCSVQVFQLDSLT